LKSEIWPWNDPIDHFGDPVGNHLSSKHALVNPTGILEIFEQEKWIGQA
jgi:hypothetical protein